MKKLFSELKRRNVLRVAGMYVIIGWIIIQIIAVMPPRLNPPDRIEIFFPFFLLAGLPIVLLITWAFELTSSGIKRSRAVTAEENSRPKTGRKIDIAIASALAIIAAMIIWQIVNRPYVIKDRFTDIHAVERHENEPT